MKKIISKKVFEIFCWVTALAVFGVAVWFYLQPTNSTANFQRREAPEKVWQTAPVESALDFTQKKVLAEVVSLEKAYVSSRRAGVIQDVYLDVGDDVFPGQVVASLLPEGVAGQDQALIAQSQARIDQAQSALELAQKVETDSVAVAVKNWRQANVNAQTKVVTDVSSVDQLNAEKQEAILISDQIWENIKTLLFGYEKNYNYIIGSFNNTIKKSQVISAALELNTMQASGEWATPKTIVVHLKHLEDFLKEVELLYSTAQPFQGLTEEKIATNLKTLQSEQLRLNSIRQSILALEEKSQSAVKAVDSGETGIEQAKKTLDLIETQQEERVTQAEKNLDIAVSQYNAVLNQFSQNQIISQYSGKVVHRMIEVGQTVNMNSQLFELEDSNTSLAKSSNYQIQAHLPESFWGKIEVGQVFKAHFPYRGEDWNVRVSNLSSQIDQARGGFFTLFEMVPKEVVQEIESGDPELIFTPDISFESPDLADGMTLYLYIDSNANTWSVSTAALKKRGSEFYVWKWVDEQPRRVTVKVVAEDGEFTQISSPELSASDSIITNPSVSLFK